MFSPDTSAPASPSAGEPELFERVVGVSRRLRRRRWAARSTGSSLVVLLAVAVAVSTGPSDGTSPSVRTVDGRVADDGRVGDGRSGGGAPSSSSEDPDDPPPQSIVGAPDIEERAPGVIPKVPTRGRSLEPGSAVPAPSGPPRIAFERVDPHNWPQVWTMGLDGSEPRQLTTGSASHLRPAWSPDGLSIAYAEVQMYSDPYHVRVMSADGTGHRTVVTIELSVLDLAWSPDGTRLAYVAAPRAPSAASAALWVVPVSGGSPRRVLDGVGAFDWSPDGSEFAVEIGGEVKVVGTDGSGARSVAAGSTPAWSPDGRSIAYSSGGRISIVGAGGSGARAITDPGGLRDAHPVWVVDAIVFERGDGMPAQCWPVGATPCDRRGAIWQVGLDGSNARHVGKGDHDYCPDVKG